jgi:hypothetical protein
MGPGGHGELCRNFSFFPLSQASWGNIPQVIKQLSPRLLNPLISRRPAVFQAGQWAGMEVLRLSRLCGREEGSVSIPCRAI